MFEFMVLSILLMLTDDVYEKGFKAGAESIEETNG